VSSTPTPVALMSLEATADPSTALLKSAAAGQTVYRLLRFGDDPEATAS
jgi:hypothetical protein